ncbi:hypothetical protein R1flu_021150 [Riccia fluitans]|uniref:Uncharacterized protein n=1 Tax=Riccia fluitans TaxID=41844 RepID=A0ABD1ZP31_9MARC
MTHLHHPIIRTKKQRTSSTSGGPISAVEDKEVASSTAEAEEAKKLTADVPEFQLTTTIHETKASSGDLTELTVDTLSMKLLAPSSGDTQQEAVVVERHASVDTTQPAAAKSEMVAGTLRPHSEQKSLLRAAAV